jgi:hypothetical protein
LSAAVWNVILWTCGLYEFRFLQDLFLDVASKRVGSLEVDTNASLALSSLQERE